MKDEDKTKEQSTNELVELRQRIAELEKSENQCRQAEKALREAEAKYRNIVETTDEGIWTIDADNKTNYINKRGAELLGYTVEEMLGRPAIDFVFPEDIPAGMRALASRKRGEKEESDFRMRRKDGTELLVHAVATPILNEKGEYRGALAVYTDITERKQAEEKLRESEIRYRTLFKQSPDGVLIIDPQTAVAIEFNEVAHRQLGYTRDEFKTLRIFDYEVKERFEETKAHIEKVLRGGRNDFETLHHTKDGIVRNIMVTVQAIELSGRKVLHCIFRDITELKRAEEELRRAKELSDALNKIDEAINSTLDFDEIMQRVVVESGKALAVEASGILLREGNYWVVRYLYGLPEEIIGMKFTDQEVSHIALAARTKKPVAINDTYSDERINREVAERFGVKSVLIIPLIVREEVIGIIGFNYHSAPVTLTEAQVDFANKLGASLSLALENARLFESVQKELAERKRIEETLKNYATKLEETNRLKDLFTDIMRHDLLNPLGIIKTATEQILFTETKDERMCNTLQMVKRNADKLIDMIKSASIYAMLESAEKLERKSLDLSEIFREVANNFKLQLEEKNMKLEYISKGGCCVMANPMIDTVFSNLLSNAIKYSPAGRKIEVNIIEEKEHFKIYVKDWGYGIRDEDKPKIFTRFQRVDKKGVKGTGLGLAIARRVVDLHGGKIWIEDNLEGGSVFCVEIPKA